jgi:hypothetical protein
VMGCDASQCQKIADALNDTTYSEPPGLDVAMKASEVSIYDWSLLGNGCPLKGANGGIVGQNVKLQLVTNSGNVVGLGLVIDTGTPALKAEASGSQTRARGICNLAVALSVPGDRCYSFGDIELSGSVAKGTDNAYSLDNRFPFWGDPNVSEASNVGVGAFTARLAKEKAPWSGPGRADIVRLDWSVRTQGGSMSLAHPTTLPLRWRACKK